VSTRITSIGATVKKLRGFEVNRSKRELRLNKQGPNRYYKKLIMDQNVKLQGPNLILKEFKSVL
jgi:hypothetical protein